MSDTKFCLTAFIPFFPKPSINLSPLPASPNIQTSRNSVGCCQKSSSSSCTMRKMDYITLLGSSKTQQPTHQTIPPRSPNHARSQFTTHRYVTMIRHWSAPKNRRFTRSGIAILPLSKPPRVRLDISSSAWSKTRG